MKDTIEDWALFWGIPRAALSDLRRRLIAGVPPPGLAAGESEAAVQTRIRLEASRNGVYLWRNNVGVAAADDGSPVRYGLANDSPQVNRVLKSSDLIGLRPLRVTPQMIGGVVGQFVAREVKRSDWVYRGTPREVAQRRFLELVKAAGGDACFAIGEGTL